METIQRRQTVAVRVGPVMVGYGHPVVVQSMTNTDTADAAATAGQVAALALSGSELVRITVNNDPAARAVPENRCPVARPGDRCPAGRRFSLQRASSAQPLSRLRQKPWPNTASTPETSAPAGTGTRTFGA